MDLSSALPASMATADISGLVTGFYYWNGVRAFETGDDISVVHVSADASGSIAGWKTSIDDNSWYISLIGAGGGSNDRTRNLSGAGGAYNYPPPRSWVRTSVPLLAAARRCAAGGRLALGAVGFLARPGKGAQGFWAVPGNHARLATKKAGRSPGL